MRRGLRSLWISVLMRPHLSPPPPLFKHELLLSSPLSFPTWKPQLDMQQTILDCSRESVVVVTLPQFPRHLHYSYVCCGCVYACAREWGIKERVKRLRLLMMRITELTAITTTTTRSQISLGTSCNLCYTANTHEAPVEPVSKSDTIVSEFLFRG